MGKRFCRKDQAPGVEAAMAEGANPQIGRVDHQETKVLPSRGITMVATQDNPTQDHLKAPPCGGMNLSAQNGQRIHRLNPKRCWGQRPRGRMLKLPAAAAKSQAHHRDTPPRDLIAHDGRSPGSRVITFVP
jgi:hypothetical protein